jgi:hypothetical protein
MKKKIRDLKLHNIAILLRWWWRLYKDPTSLLTATLTKTHGQGGHQQRVLILSKHGSFFWKQLQGLKPMFRWCTAWIVNSGNNISFWFNSWQNQPLIDVTRSTQGVQQPRISLRKATQKLRVLLPCRYNKP